MITLNTNVTSMIAANSLKQNGRLMNQAMEQLATGIRINKAADDASGMAMVQSMSAVTRGLEVAMRNANDGISLLQTADSGLEEVADMLQRMRDLAVQASTGTLSASQRQHLQTEAMALADQVDNTLNNTAWNGRSVFGREGLAGGLEFQIGTRGHPINIANGGAADTVKTTAGSSNVVIKDPAHGLVVGEVVRVTSTQPVGGMVLSWRSRVLAVAADGSSFTVGQGFNAPATSNDQGSGGVVTWQRAVSTLGARLGTQLEAVKKSTLFGAGSDMGDAARSTAAIEKFDAALVTVGNARASLGTIINFLSRNISNNLVLSINMRESSSRVLDTDYAAATVELARGQILQQAGTAMLAQANQQPRAVLELLQS
jgi:flagellin